MKIDRFEGEHRWLSNFWPATVYLGMEPYPTVEHAYQAAKFLDANTREIIRKAATPGLAKKLGRSFKIRSDWDAVKLTVMEALVRQKFAHPDLRDKLKATGDAELVEGNWWNDRFWGTCGGEGLNYLGKILMSVRSEL